MRKKEKIKIQELIGKAKSNNHHEAYISLDRNRNYRIGVAARTMPLKTQIFIEILVYLPNTGKVDLQDLKRKLAFLEELQKRNYSLQYQEGNFIACETEVSPKKLEEEYKTIKMLTRHVHS
ncbi:MAG: hypothetical protein QXN87_02725 [Candidatus Bathyarchaeia archaeon]